MTRNRFLTSISLIVLVLSSCSVLKPAPTSTPFILTTAAPAGGDATSVPAGQVNLASGEFESELIEAVACPMETYGGIAPSCGYLTVPVDADRPDMGTLKVMFAVFETRSTTPKPDPLLFASGFPIVSRSGFVPFFYQELLKERDVIVFDPRGTGLSQPNLDCSEMSAALVGALSSGNLNPDQQAEMHQQCRQKIQGQYTDLSVFDYRSTADDLRLLRQALGYSQWNVFAFNSGARLMLDLLDVDPGGIRSLLMSNPYPPQANDLESGRAIAQALSGFFELCAQDEKCAAPFPELEKNFYRLADQLNDQPISIQVNNLQSGERYQMRVDGDMLITIVLGILDSGSTEYMGYVPRMVFHTLEGKYDALSKLAGQYSEGVGMAQVGLPTLQACFDRPMPSEADVESAVVDLQPALAEFIRHQMQTNRLVCEAWGTPPAYPMLTRLPTANIPILLLADDQNWQVPRAWVDQVAGLMPGAQVISLPMGSNGFSREWFGCVNAIMESFMANPAISPSAQCLAETPKITWITLP